LKTCVTLTVSGYLAATCFKRPNLAGTLAVVPCSLFD
jgi:ABC-type iron transport system FetAB permease component